MNIIICGAGRVGYTIAKLLSEQDHSITVIDQSSEDIQKINEDLVNVFVPTTPNPTSGFLLMVPKKDLIYLDVSFEQASKFIVSAGTSNMS